jgi:phosphoribosyl 1,2-cyclic phosphodiesterase
MKLKVIASGSSGNAYLLANDQEALLIECGIRFLKIKEALNFNLRPVVGCIVTHEHQDHCAGVKDAIKAGIYVYASAGTHEAMGTIASHRAKVVTAGKPAMIGGFRIIPFDIKHDCAEPLGYLINHAETGTILFLTDSYYVENTFRGLNNIILEANYCQAILDARLKAGEAPRTVRDRVIESHMSLDTCKKTLQANDLSAVNNIVLIHLSNGNSDAGRFKREVEEATGKVVHIAAAGLTIDHFNKTPF